MSDFETNCFIWSEVDALLNFGSERAETEEEDGQAHASTDEVTLGDGDLLVELEVLSFLSKKKVRLLSFVFEWYFSLSICFLPFM